VPSSLPAGLILRAFWSGTSARTSELRARVDALRGTLDPLALARLRRVAIGRRLRRRPRRMRAPSSAPPATYGRALDTLGRAADAPVVPPAFAELATLAETLDSAAFLPSGAGGGDVGVWLDIAPPPARFCRARRALGMSALALNVDRGGVRLETPPS
jgi:hypothetical protein